MNDYVISLIRTTVPVAVGALVVWLASRTGIVLDESASAGLTAFCVGVAIAVYYGIVRALETRWPALGRLLGAKKAPVYQEVARR